MASYSAKILNNAQSGLETLQAVLAAASNNIANAGTDSYSRRTVELQTRRISDGGSGLAVGNGVEVATVSRASDEYVEQLLRSAIAQREGSAVQDDYIARIEELFSLDGQNQTIGGTMTAFFNAVEDLIANPSSLELRTNLIERGNDFVSTIKNTYNTIASMQTEIDSRLGTEISTVNSLTAQIAELNIAVGRRESTGELAADERDQRDALLNKLAEKLTFTTTEDDDGKVNVFLDGGFALVSGATSRDLELTQSPSFASGPIASSLDGQILNFIVYDYDTTSGHADLDLTGRIGAGEGIIGGLLAIRGVASISDTSPFDADGVLVDIGSRIEAISRDLLTTVNLTYLGSDENSGLAGYQPSSRDLNGNAPAVYGLFDFTYSGIKDADGDGRPDDLGALGISSFSNLLSFAPDDPYEIAAARDLDATAGSVQTVSGDGSNLRAIADLRTTSTTFTQGSFSLTGTYQDVYDNMVTVIGNKRLESKINKGVGESAYLTAANRRDQIAGVSIDEEFTKMVQFQRQFQANAKMIKVGDSILEQIINL